jgi:DNA-binding NtrC family response regulator
MGRQKSPLKTHLSTRSAETLSRRIDFWREITATLLSDITSKVFFDHIELENGIKFDEEVKGFEIKLIKQALELVGGKQARAAKLLDIKRSTLSSKIKRYNIDLGK